MMNSSMHVQEPPQPALRWSARLGAVAGTPTAGVAPPTAATGLDRLPAALARLLATKRQREEAHRDLRTAAFAHG
jgi:hypothetical protein